MSLQQRRPFGSAAANGAVHKYRKGYASIEPRKSKTKAHLSRSQQNTSHDERRKSKTPKTSNLSTVGGAYSFQTEFDGPTKEAVKADQRHRGAVKKPSRAKPDPSPIKRPDPDCRVSVNQPIPAAADRLSGLLSTKGMAIGKPKPISKAVAKHNSSSAEPTMSPRNTIAAYNSSEGVFKSNAASSTGISRRTDLDASSDMEVDSECSSPEKSSPLITSPYSKPDPEAAESSTGKMGSRIGKTVSTAAAASSKTEDPTPIERFKVEEVSEEVLARARTGPIENKGVLEAMLNSTNNRAIKRHDASQTEESGPSLIGSIIGGAALRSSASLDGSEVTMPSFSASKLVRGHQSVGTAEVFRKSGSISIPSNNIQLAASNNSSIKFLSRPTAEESVRLSMQIRDQLQSGYTYPSQIHLPAGWQVRISKSKGKPYYVHPDFGSTWHYPGLIVGPHIAVQNGLFVDQSVDVSRFTSQASTFQKNFDASNTVQSTMSKETSKCGDESKEKSATDLASSAGKRSNDAVVLDKSADSQASFSNHSKCLIQDSFVNSEVHKSKNDATNSSGGSDVNATAELKPDVFSACDEVEFETGGDEIERSQCEDECQIQDTEENDDVEFGTDLDNFDSYDDGDLTTEKDELLSKASSIKDDESNIDEHESMEGIESTIDAVKRDDVNSLASDHVDVSALLRQSACSPLATINETLRESLGKLSRQSSQVSLDSTSDDEDRVEVGSEKSKSYPADESSQVSQEGSVHEKSDNNQFDDGGDEFDDNGFDLASDGFGDDEASSVCEKQHAQYDNNEDVLDGYGFDLGGGFVDEENPFGNEVKKESSGFEVEASSKQPKKRRKKLPPVRRKTFPPGPLCSLQMLEMIEDGSLDTPLWRMGRRKRSTWTSVKRAKESRKARRISA